MGEGNEWEGGGEFSASTSYPFSCVGEAPLRYRVDQNRRRDRHHSGFAFLSVCHLSCPAGLSWRFPSAASPIRASLPARASGMLVSLLSSPISPFPFQAYS